MFEKIDKMEETIIDALGISDTLDAILRALSYYEKKNLFEFIIRMYDLNKEEEKEET